MMVAWEKLRRALAAFCRSRKGNVAITFAFATLPILGFVGAAIDYSRANSVKAAMQTALDSTALMLSKEAATDSQDQLKENALKFFTTLFTRTEAQDIHVDVSYSTVGGSNVVLNATASLPADFVKILGFDTFTVKASSTAKWGITRLRVALVLDNTGSMSSDGKMAALKTATKKLLTQLQSAATTPGDVYVSIIPFVKDVNLGSSNYNADWVYWGTTTGANPQDPLAQDNTSWDALNGNCSSGSWKSRSKCLANVGTCSVPGYFTQDSCTSSGLCSDASYNVESTCVSHGVCSKSKYTKKSQCVNNGGTWTLNTWTSLNGIWTTTGTWTPKNHNTWNGCVMDRGNWDDPDTIYNYDTNAVAPDPITPRYSSFYAAEQFSSCPQAVMGLSYDWSSMTSLVDAMTPGGNTNQAIGLQVGWMSLVGGGPFTVPPLDPAFQYTQVIILLTDGLNTENRWTTSESEIDARQQITCDNIKAQKIQLYTIQVNTGGDPTSTLLQNCASDPSKFYLLTSADQMTATFETIGTNLTKLRVAQ
ncbi:MAG TPA: pilus assembly protein [Pseudolabrys sp.]|nr:pilus assembly protein [Pseudolabrys sp.]